MHQEEYDLLTHKVYGDSRVSAGNWFVVVAPDTITATSRGHFDIKTVEWEGRRAWGTRAEAYRVARLLGGVVEERRGILHRVSAQPSQSAPAQPSQSAPAQPSQSAPAQPAPKTKGTVGPPPALLGMCGMGITGIR